MKKEPVTSRRISIINQSTREIYDKVDELSEALMDRDQSESLHIIVELQSYIKGLKDQTINGDFL